MSRPKPISLKGVENRRTLIGLHIDELLAKASANGYAVNVLYGSGLPLRSAGAKILTVRLDDTNKVTAVR